MAQMLRLLCYSHTTLGAYMTRLTVKLCRLVSYGDSETSSPEASNQKERVLYPWLNGVTC